MRADADQERVGAGAAGEAGGLGIEEGPAWWDARSRMAPAESDSQQVLGQFGQIGDIDAAVAAVALPQLLGLEVLPEGGGAPLRRTCSSSMN